MGVKYFPTASGRKQNWDSYHQHTSTTCWVNLRRLRKSGRNGHWWSCEKRQPWSPWAAFHSYLWVGRKDAPSSLNPTECNSKGGKDTWLFCGLRGPYRRFLGLNYLASTSSKVTHSASDSREVDPRGPVVGAQEEAELQPCCPYWGSCNRGGLVRHLHRTKDLDACHSNSINHPPGQPEKQHSQQEMFKVKKSLLYSHLHSSSVLSLKEYPFQVSQGKRRALNQLWSFKWTGKLWNLLETPLKAWRVFKITQLKMMVWETKLFHV